MPAESLMSQHTPSRGILEQRSVDTGCRKMHIADDGASDEHVLNRALFERSISIVISIFMSFPRQVECNHANCPDSSVFQPAVRRPLPLPRFILPKLFPLSTIRLCDFHVPYEGI